MLPKVVVPRIDSSAKYVAPWRLEKKDPPVAQSTPKVPSAALSTIPVVNIEEDDAPAAPGPVPSTSGDYFCFSFILLSCCLLTKSPPFNSLLLRSKTKGFEWRGPFKSLFSSFLW